VWVAEAIGLASQTTAIVGGKIVLSPPLDGIESFPSIAALCG
jgi:hypothetical protein